MYGVSGGGWENMYLRLRMTKRITCDEYYVRQLLWNFYSLHHFITPSFHPFVPFCLHRGMQRHAFERFMNSLNPP